MFFDGPSADILFIPHVLQRVAMGTIFCCFRGAGANVKMMLPYHSEHLLGGWSGSRETSCAAHCTQCFWTCFLERLLVRMLPIWIPNGGPLDGLGAGFLEVMCLLILGSILGRASGRVGAFKCAYVQNRDASLVTPAY